MGWMIRSPADGHSTEGTAQVTLSLWEMGGRQVVALHLVHIEYLLTYGHLPSSLAYIPPVSDLGPAAF